MTGYVIMVKRTTETGTTVTPWTFGGVLVYSNKKTAIHEVVKSRLARIRYGLNSQYIYRIEPVEVNL